MRAVSDEFLLGLAEVVATLIGFLLVAMFFYIERKKGELAGAWEVGFPYLRAAVRLILLLYSMSLAISLGLVVLDEPWVALITALLSLAVLATAVEITLRHRALAGVAHIGGTSPWLVWATLAFVLLPPWIAGGVQPGRTLLTLAALLTGGFAFVNTIGLLLSAFDIERMLQIPRAGEASDQPEPDAITGIGLKWKERTSK